VLPSIALNVHKDGFSHPRQVRGAKCVFLGQLRFPVEKLHAQHAELEDLQQHPKALPVWSARRATTKTKKQEALAFHVFLARQQHQQAWKFVQNVRRANTKIKLHQKSNVLTAQKAQNKKMKDSQHALNAVLESIKIKWHKKHVKSAKRISIVPRKNLVRVFLVLMDSHP